MIYFMIDFENVDVDLEILLKYWFNNLIILLGNDNLINFAIQYIYLLKIIDILSS